MYVCMYVYTRTHTNQVDEEWQKHEMDAGKDALTAILVIHKTMTSFAKKFLVTEQQKRNQGSPADGCVCVCVCLCVCVCVCVCIYMYIYAHTQNKKSVVAEQKKRYQGSPADGFSRTLKYLHSHVHLH